VAQRASVSDPWEPPAHLGDVVNTTFAENVPALSRDKHWMFFTSDRPGGAGSVDIWAAWRANRHDDFGWDFAVNLASNVNSTAFDAGPAYLENEDVGVPLLFFTRNLPGSNDFDVRVSEQASDGSFGPSTLVSELNSPFNEGRPTVRFDGLELFFHSNQLRNEFWIETTALGDIVAWSDSGPASLGYSARTLGGRSLIVMFVQNRPQPSMLAPALMGHPIEREGRLRPKDRRAVDVVYRIERVDDSRDGQPVLRWTFVGS
jgi:PAS domain-containing protein